MKVLSIKQPWAELVLQGRKTIELRKWNTNFRGEFLIHASKHPDIPSMKRSGFKGLPCGFIVGVARLVGVKKYPEIRELDKDKNLHLADGKWGNYGFILKDARRIKPIPAKGNLGFWEFQVD